MITIYTDGSSRGNPGPGGWGAVIIYDHGEVGSKEYEVRVKEIGGREDHTTNNRMELLAAIESLKFLTTYSLLPTTVQIYTDSKYVMLGITEWIHNWVAKGWRTAGKKPVQNQDLWQELLNVSSNLDIRWEYVAGHTGDHGNERADTIATSFADLPRGSRGAESIDLYDGPKSEYK